MRHINKSGVTIPDSSGASEPQELVDPKELRLPGGELSPNISGCIVPNIQCRDMYSQQYVVTHTVSN